MTKIARSLMLAAIAGGTILGASGVAHADSSTWHQYYLDGHKIWAYSSQSDCNAKKAELAKTGPISALTCQLAYAGEIAQGAPQGYYIGTPAK